MLKDQLTEMTSQIVDLFSTFEEDSTKSIEKSNSAAAQRARKALGEIKKMVTEYRKTSVSYMKECKKNKKAEKAEKE